MNKLYFLLLLLLCWSNFCVAQSNENGGSFSGNLQSRVNFFQRDSSIGAFNTPQYDRQLYGAENWLDLNYSNWGFDFSVRFDFFNNSNLLNPQDSYSDQGLGRWFVHKRVDKLDLSAGYIYDQIGSGLIFRAYQERPLLIDNALYGVRLAYELSPDWQVKGFTGKQKRQFENYASTIRGGSIEGYWADTLGRFSVAPGFGITSRTFDDETVNQVVSTISTYTPTDSIGVNYNTYAFTLYNTFTFEALSWYFEAAYKSSETIFDPFAEKLNWTGQISQGKFVNESGTALYTSLGYATKGLGLTLEARRVENFTYRATPFASLNEGIINFLPSLTRINTYRLTTRYVAATQELGETAVQLDLSYSPNRTWRYNVNGSWINRLDGTLLYRELYATAQYRYKREWSVLGGFQIQRYNQSILEGKPDVPLVETFALFGEYNYKIDRKKSLSIEVQYLNTAQDFGSWLFGLFEFNLAPKWVFTISDMYNIDPTSGRDDIHFPRFDVYFTPGNNRFSLSYIKQVEGVVCAGGICRLEPAFSGVQLTVNSQF